MINLRVLAPGSSHHVWNTELMINIKDVTRATIKLRIATGTYPLNSMLFKFGILNSPNCETCHDGSAEDIHHLILGCVAYTDVRNHLIPLIMAIERKQVHPSNI